MMGGSWQGQPEAYYAFSIEFYICFLKIDVIICEGLPVFEFAIFSCVFLMISVKVFLMHFMWVL